MGILGGVLKETPFFLQTLFAQKFVATGKRGQTGMIYI